MSLNSRSLPSNSEIILANNVRQRNIVSIIGTILIGTIVKVYCFVTKGGGLVLDGEEHLLRVLILAWHN